jgi:hypothetical protein
MCLLCVCVCVCVNVGEYAGVCCMRVRLFVSVYERVCECVCTCVSVSECACVYGTQLSPELICGDGHLGGRVGEEEGPATTDLRP